MGQAAAETEDDQMESWLVDCDVHLRWKDESEVIQYLPDRYQDTGIMSPDLLHHNDAGFWREDAYPEEGMPGSDITVVQEDYLDEAGVTHAITTGNTYLDIGGLPNRDYAFELARAVNTWMVNDLLPQDDRLLGSLLVAPQAPDRMAEHIRDLGPHDRIVQILLPGGGQLPMGHPRYWPIYEAAADVGLPVALHPYDEGHGVKHAPTGAGHPNWYLEWHTLMTATFIGQLASVVAEGVLSKFDLDFVFIEGGIEWLPMMMWRLDKNWRSLRGQTPWIERPPSEIIRDQVYVTTQPIPEPPVRKHLEWMLEMIFAEDTLMYASDYPHWDADPPEFGVGSLPENLGRRVRWENANEVYDFPDGMGP